MRRLANLVVLCASLASILPAQNIPLSEYRTRREALRKDLDGTIILQGTVHELSLVGSVGATAALTFGGTRVASSDVAKQ